MTGAKLTLEPAASVVINVREEFANKPPETSFTFTQGRRSFNSRGPRRYLNVSLESAEEFNFGKNGFLRPPSGPDDTALEIQDVLPGRYTQVWFEATKTGNYHLFCAEYCGTSHSGMIGRVVVMDPMDFERWLATSGNIETMASAGEQLFRKYGCAACHQETSSSRGPKLAGLFQLWGRFRPSRSSRTCDSRMEP